MVLRVALGIAAHMLALGALLGRTALLQVVVEADGRPILGGGPSTNEILRHRKSRLSLSTASLLALAFALAFGLALGLSFLGLAIAAPTTASMPAVVPIGRFSRRIVATSLPWAEMKLDRCRRHGDLKGSIQWSHTCLVGNDVVTALTRQLHKQRFVGLLDLMDINLLVA